MSDDAKERARAVWSTGDYAPFGRQIEPASTQLVSSAGIGAGHTVLDVAAGNGNLALAAARTGARVTATDFSDVMVEAGRRRTADAGLTVDWQVADAEELPFEDDQFDFVTSVFGVMFAPRQQQAARELLRTARPGGTVAVAAWTADGRTREMFEVLDRFGPPSEEEGPDPLLWGTEAGVEELFAGASEVRCERHAVTFSYPSMAALTETMEAHGVLVVLKQHLPPDRYAAMTDAMSEMTERWNRGTGGAVVYDVDYLATLVRK